jgi:photosystem II stability/assembly factor-like uncharacterized protein
VKLPTRKDSFVSSLHFVNENHGLISEIRNLGGLSDLSDLCSWIFSTNDGGITWQEEVSETNSELSKVLIDSKGGLWAIGRRFEAGDVAKVRPLLMAKSPGDNSWSRIDAPDSLGVVGNVYDDTNANNMLFVTNLGNIAILDGRHRWYIREGVKLMKSSQIGISSIGKSPNNRVYLIGATGGREGVWTSLFRQKTDSEEWTEIELTNVILMDLLFPGPDEIIGAGLFLQNADDPHHSQTVASILHSVDGGKTWWISYQSQKIGRFEKLFISNNKSLLAVGKEGQVLRLTLTEESGP